MLAASQINVFGHLGEMRKGKSTSQPANLLLSSEVGELVRLSEVSLEEQGNADSNPYLKLIEAGF